MNTRRLLPAIDPVDAKVALLNRARLPLAVALRLIWSEFFAVVAFVILGNETNLIRTSYDASPASDALILVYQYQVVLVPLVTGPGWTNRNAGRLITVVAANR